MRKLLPILLVALLAACGGTKQTTSIPASWSPGASLIYAYPYDGQARIAPTAPIVLQFSTVVSVLGGAPLASAFTITPDGGSPIAFTASATNGGQGVVLTPSAPLTENTHYTIAWNNLTAPDGLIPAVPLAFTTRPAVKGAASSISSSSTFQIDRALPTQGNFPFMDFSTLRLQFSQPIDVKTLTYGQNVRLEDDTATLVPATVLVTGHLLSIDPRSDLVAGRSYHLKLDTTLKSILGTALTPGAYSDFVLVPKDSGPRSTMALQVPDSAAGTVVSPLTGAAINNVPITSALLGNNSASQQAGNLYAELAFVPHFPDVTPLTMRRGNMLSGSSVDVKIVGTVPTGINTGAIHVNIISDATGYMVPNPYSKAIDAPRLVYLTMDASMSADDSSANGAFTQNLLQIEVVGTAIVKNGKLVMDAVGVTELDVLGLDRASGVLSFHLEGYQDQSTAPAQVADTTPPTLQSWLPGNEAKRARPGDPVILNFTEPLDPDSVNDTNLQLLRNGVAVPISTRVDGAAVVMLPATPLEHNVQYTVAFSNAMTDLAGNGVSDATYQRTFSLAALITPGSHSPSVVTTYPGYPCVTTGRSVASGVQGRCAGGLSSDDLLPLPTMPLDRAIQVQFSQSMSAGSIVLGSTCGTGSFRVERVDATGTCLGTVPGRIEVNPQSLRFFPAAPWTQGTLYRYVLNSNGNGQSATATCDGTQAICGSNGLPLQTQPLAASASTAPTATGGGPLMEIWFTGAAHSPWVAQRLRGLPAYDSNANFVHDSGEDTAVDTGGGFWRAPNGA
ncbi:MAG TPA: Ig-like domain-containing protein, partial [Moraxellaceae bacterium]|nr:Ig-like domain-containing protein [Moraxellaceae bacterium]